MKQNNFLRTLLFFTLTIVSFNSFSQVTLVSNGFEGGDTWTVSSGSPTSNSIAGASDTPANSRIKSGTKSWIINNTTETVEFTSQDITGKTGVKAIVYISSTAGTSGNGADAGDYIRVWANVNGGGFPATADIEITGNSNARWNYNANLTATTAAGTNISNGAPQGGTNANNYATLTITIPDGSTSVALKVEGKNNSSNEIWNIDDITLIANGSDPTVGFDSATSSTTETDTSTAFNIPVSFINYDSPVTVTAAVTGGTAEGGDYTLTTSTATFGANETKNIVLTVNDDADTDDETVELTISVTSGTADLGTSVHTVTIIDDEIPPVPTAGTVFITEVSDASSSSNEFIELYNKNNFSVDLSTSKLVMLTDGTVFDFDGTDLSTASIPANGFLILTRGSDKTTFEGVFGTLNANTTFVQGKSSLFFGTSTARRWQLKTGGTNNTDDGTLIDDTDTGVGGSNRHYQNIFTDSYISTSDSNANPGELDYLIYNNGAWVNSSALDGTTGAKNAYIYDDLVISTNIEANDVGIIDNEGIEVNAGQSITINGNLTLNGSNSYIQANGSIPSAGVINSASVILKGTYTSGGSNQFKYFSDTYHNNDSGWTLVSSPTNGEVIDGGATGFATFNKLKISTNDLGGGVFNYGIALYDNSLPYVSPTSPNRWDYYTTTEIAATNNVTMTSGKGYSVLPNSTAGANQNKGNLGFKGAISTIDESITLTDNTSGVGNDFNLIGNPYPAFLPFNTTANATNLLTTNSGELAEQTIWFWDKASSSYITVNQTTTVGTGPNQRASLYIAPTQGFFVKSKTGGGSFSFTKAMQSIQASGTFNKSENIRPEIQLNISDNTISKTTLIYYYDNKTIGFDNGYDSSLFNGVSNSFAVYTQLVSNNDSRNLAIQSLPDSDYENMVIPIGLKAEAGKEITFTAEAFNMPSGIKVFLEDRLTNTFTRLDETNNAYKVNLTEASDGVGRFYLHTTQSSLSIDNNTILNSVNIYKLNNSTLRIAGLPQGKASISLFNILGKKVLTSSFDANRTNDISLPKLETGVYFIKLQTASGKIDKKIILE